MMEQYNGIPVWPVVVVGAGAAGLMAAIFAARAGNNVLILETRRQPGAKIRVSGGSRCNVLPSEVSLGDFHTSSSQHALRNILFSWPLHEVRSFFENTLAVPLKTEVTGKVFPRSDRSKDVVDALLLEAFRLGVTLRGQARVTALGRRDTHWHLTLEHGERIAAARVVLATGGLSLPKTGSDGGGWRLAAALGHSLTATHPALVPLCSDDHAWTALAGLTVPVRLQAHRAERLIASQCGDLLFTHRGFSGPVALDMSYYCTAPDSDGVCLLAHFAPNLDWDHALRQGTAQTIIGSLRDHLPRRLADLLVQRANVDATLRLAELSRAQRGSLVQALTQCRLHVVGNEGYATAEVTAGGIPLDGVHVKTLESRKAPGVYFVGEMLDVVGRLGGYNFLWAWVSGRRAGLMLH